MKLLKLPQEIVHIISTYLPKRDVNKLCLTCKKGYQAFLPIVYEHVELGHRAHIKQLKQGLLCNSFLRDTIYSYTHTLTLKCKQGGNSHWLVISLFEQLPNIKKLHFVDFPALSIGKVEQILTSMPRLSHLTFQYCDLTDATTKDNDVVFLPNLTEINLLWTDFTAEAIKRLFGFTPNLTCLSLGANRNRKRQANDSSLKSLMEQCLKVSQLSISLQQVEEATICKVIQQYGQQLTRLSIRCEGNDTLKMISDYNKKLEYLDIRCSSHTPIQGRDINQLLQECSHLNQLKMIGWPIQNLPSIILEHIHHKKTTHNNFLSSNTPSTTHHGGIYHEITDSMLTRSHHLSSPSTSSIQGTQKTVDLDKHDLQEIRRIYVCMCKENQDSIY